MTSLRATHTQATVAALLQAGRTLFGSQGYDATGLDEIAAAAGVTTGAIYHHFSSKKGLFQAVAEAVEASLIADIARTSPTPDWGGLVASFLLLLDACTAPDIQRIIFDDAPRVIGIDAWREIEMRYAYGVLANAIQGLADEGEAHAYPVALTAPLLVTALAEAARSIAANPNHRDAARELLTRWLNALRVD